MTSGKLEEAARYYRAAIETKPDYRIAHFNLGRILVQQGQFREAVEQFLQTLEPEDQETPVYTYALAAAYARAGDRQNALKYTKQARQKAEALGQKELVISINRDLKLLEPGTNPP
jgi:predicted Zn-dependent protease